MTRQLDTLAWWSALACFTALATACASMGSTPPAPQIPTSPAYTSPGERSLAMPDQSLAAPGQRHGDDAQTLAPGKAVTGQWWKVFGSPALDSLVDDALSGSRTLAAAKARLTAEQEEVRAVRAARYPEVELNAGATREKQSAASFGLPSGALPLPANFNLYQLGVNGAYDSDLFGRISQRVAQQTALAEAQRGELEATYLTLAGDTVSAAIQLAETAAERQAIGAILQLDRDTLQLVQKAYEVGTVSESDVVSASSQLASDETLQPDIEQQLSATGHALAVLVGRPPADWFPTSFSFADLTLPHELPLVLPSELVHRRPDILASEAELRASGAQLRLATADLYPQISLSAGATAESLTLRNLFDPAGLVWSVAAGITQPLFDAGMRRARRRAALAQFQASAADYQQTVLRAFQQIADLLTALAHDDDLLQAHRRAVAAASRSVTLQRANYEKGAIGVLNLLDAQREYRHAVLEEVRARGQHYQHTVALLVAMGGDDHVTTTAR